MVLEDEDLIVDFKLFEEDCFWVPKKFGCIICEEQNGSYLIAIGIWFFYHFDFVGCRYNNPNGRLPHFVLCDFLDVHVPKP
jgi:hypothetical protein